MVGIVVALCINFICVQFLLVRWKLVLALFNLAISPLRLANGWKAPRLEASDASQVVLNVRFIIEKGWRVRTRICISAVLVIMSMIATYLVTWLPIGLVIVHCFVDAVLVVASPPPQGALSWKLDSSGVPYGIQPSQFSKHVVFTGGVSLACYTCGVLDFLFRRYGAEPFQNCDFAGASSGSWTAACGVYAAHGAGSVRDVFEHAFISAVSLIDLFPCGLLFMGCQAVEEFTSFVMHSSRVDAPAAYKAVAEEGKLAVWLFGFTWNRAHTNIGGAYRLVVRKGSDFTDARSVGALVAATSVFPYFTCPRLSSRLHCTATAMDGYFPGKGVSVLPVPDMALPCDGRVLLFDMSGGMAERYKDDPRVRVLSIKSWDRFKFKDWAASSPEAIEDLFERGARDAELRTAEIDAAMNAIFVVQPKASRVAAYPPPQA